LRHVLMRRGAPKLVGFMPLSWRALRYGGALRAGQADKHALRPGGTGLHDAPELRGASHASASALAAADVWGLGIVLVSLLSGSPPSLMGASGEHLTAAAGPVHAVQLPDAMHAAPAALTALASAMLSMDPADRPSIEAVSTTLAMLVPSDPESPSLTLDASAGGSVGQSCPLSPAANPTGAPHTAKRAFEPLPPRVSDLSGSACALSVGNSLTGSASVGSSLGGSSTRSASPACSPDNPAARADASSPFDLGAASSANAAYDESACGARGGPSHGKLPTTKLPTTGNEGQPASSLLVFRRLQPRYSL